MAEIVTANLDDAPALAALGRDTFVDTFGHLYPPEDLATFLAATYVPATFAGFLADAMPLAIPRVWPRSLTRVT